MPSPGPDHHRAPPLPHDVKRAVDYMRQHLGRKIRMAELVTASGVAERTLGKHFCAFLGRPPLSYLRQLRLAAARERLLGASDGTSVTRVATHCGFAHFGRFSDQYRRSFGEAPSATLRRARSAIIPAAGRSDGKEHVGSGDADACELPWPRLSRERPSIAVLPCVIAETELSERCLAEDAAEAIAAALSSLRALSVMAPRRRGVSSRDPQQLARDFGARYFLIGRLVVGGERLRLIIRIVETATGHHVWGDSYDGERKDFLSLQDRAIGGVARAVLPSIRRAEIERAQRLRPEDLDASGLAMRSLPFVFASQPEATRRALELLRRALEIDPDYGLAAALAAWCHAQLVMYNGSHTPEAERQEAVRLAQRAALLGSDDPLALSARCAVHTMMREFDTADSLVARALALDPACAWTWGRSGWLNSYLGNSEIAIDHFRRAISLDSYSPANANNFVGIGSAYFNAGRYDTAALWLRKAMLEQPGMMWPNRTLSVCYARLGDRSIALKAVEALRHYCPDLTVTQVVAALPFRPDYLERLGAGLSDLGLPI
jgi:adenylate cyclase